MDKLMDFKRITECLLPVWGPISTFLQLPAVHQPPVELHGRKLRLLRQAGYLHTPHCTPPTTPKRLAYKSPSIEHVNQMCEQLVTTILLHHPSGWHAYRVLRQIGEGGYAIVYLCQDASADPQDPQAPQYALKKVLAGSQEALAAARQEASIQQQTQHPCILPLLDWAVVPPAASDPAANHTVYLLSPAYPHGTLAEELTRLGAVKARARGHAAGAQEAVGCVLSTRQVLHVFRQLCLALDALHARGFAHRDVKVHNILIQRPTSSRQNASSQPANHMRQPPQAAMNNSASQGQPCNEQQQVAAGKADAAIAARPHYRCLLMDFGSARPRHVQLNTRSEALQLQEDAAAHCTATFRAPELWDTPSPATLDQAACDVWSAGCTLYACMYGQSPFQVALNQGGSLALAVMNNSIPWPREPAATYPEQLHSLVQRCLATDPAQRPAAGLLAAEAAALLAQQLPDPQDYTRYARAIAAGL